MTNIQEIEEQQFIPQDETQRCWEEARIDLAHVNLSVRSKVAALVAGGRYVVVGNHPYLCKATDAVVGTAAFIVDTFATRADAEAWIRNKYATGNSEEDGDGFVVFPFDIERTRALIDESKDECPF